MTETRTESVDLLIHSRWVIPMDPARSVLPNHCVAIRDKRIVGLCPSSDAGQLYSAAAERHLNSHALIPGLVNAHGHAAMSLLRGIADDLPLKTWLEEHIWPLEGEHVSREFVYQGSTLAMAEMLRSGTTTFADMYFFPDEVARAAIDAQMRVQLASPILDFPTIWAADAEEYIRKACTLHDDFRSSEFAHTAFGPHAPYTVSDTPLRKLSMLADELDVPIHMHVHETAQEVSDAVAQHGNRPLQRLHALGMISPRLLCVHATQLDAEDIALLADNGASVIHCPESNLKLASGFCKVAALQQHQVNVALGTDGCASNNDLDMIGEMRSAAMLAKAVADDASALPAMEALAMATINGASALGMNADIGSLEVGKLADLTAVDLDAINCWPLHNPVSHLVYACNASQVSDVWVSGRALLIDGELQTIDIDLLRSQSEDWQRKISGN